VDTSDAPEVLERFHTELPLVEIIARQIARTVGRLVEFDDLVATGREGLLDAARRFDPTRDVPFRAYANLRVRGAILDGVRQNSPLPRRTYERVVALKAAAQVSEGEAECAFAAGGVADANAADRALAEHLAAIAMAAAVGMVTTPYAGSP
jgi:RNA polymerase sigma factor for flagellar operon FliA